MCDTMDKNRKKIMEELMQKLEEKNRKREENGGGRDEAGARNVLEQGIRENEVRGDDELKDKVQVDDDVLYIDKELLSDRKSKTKKRSECLKNAIKCIQCQFEVNGSEVNFVFYCPQCNEYWLILNEMMGIEGNESSINLSRLGDNVEDESKVEVLQKILADLLPSVSSEDSKDEEKYRTEIEATEKEESKASFDREQLNLAISDVIEALQSRKQDSSRSRISKSGALRQTGFFSIGIQEGAANVPESKNKPKVGAKSETASKESVNKSGKALKRKADEMNEKPSDLTDETTQQVQGKERTSGKEEEPGAVDKKESKIFYTPISVSDTYLILQNESTTKSSETGKAIDGKDSRVESLERSNTKKEIEKSVDQESIAGKSSKGTSVGEKSAKSLIKEKLPQESPKEETDRSIKSVDMQSAMGNTISELDDNLKVMMPSEFVQLEEGEISDLDHMRPEHKTSSTPAVDGKSEKSSVNSVEKGSKPGEKTFYTDMLSTISQLWSKKSVNKKSPRDRSELSSSQAGKMNKTPAEAGKEKPTGTSMESRSSMDKLESSGRDKEKISSKISSVTPSISIREVKQSSMVKSTAPKNEETSEEQTKPRTETEKGSKNGKSTVSFAGEKMVESKPIDRSNVDRTEGTGYAADVENELSMPVKDGVSEERKTESSDKSVSARSTGKNTVERSITVSSRENAQKPSQKVVGKGNSHNLVDDMRKLVEEKESLKVKKKSPNDTIKSDSSFTTQTRTTTDRSSEKSSKIYQMSDAELKEAIGDTEKLQSLEKKLNATNSTLNRHVSSIQDAVGAHDDFITAQEVVLGDETLKQMENKSREEEEQSKAEKKVQKTAEGSGVTGSSKPTLGKSMIDSLQVRKRSRSELDKEDEKAAETVPTETITVRTPTEEVFNDSDIIDNVPTEKKSFIDVLKSKIDSNRSVRDIGDHTESEQSIGVSYFENDKRKSRLGKSNEISERMFGSKVSADGKTIENIGDYNEAEQQVAEESREEMKSDGKTMENIGDYNEAEQQVVEKSRKGMKSDENMARDERENMERSVGPVSESSSPAGKTTTSSEIRTKSRNMSTITNYGSGVKSESSTSRLKNSVIKEVKNLSSIKESSSRSTSPTLSSTPVKSTKKEKGRISEIRKTLTSGQKEDKKALLSKSISSKASSSVEQKSPVPEKSKPSKASIPIAEDKSTVREPLSSGDIVFPKTPTTSNIKERKSTSVNVSTADSSTIYSNSNPLVVVDTDKKEPKEEKSSEKLPMQQKSDEKGAQPKLEKMTDGSVAKDKSLSSVGSKGVPVELMYEDVSAARKSKIKGVDGVTKKETGDEKLKGKKIEGEEKKKKLVDDKRKEGEPAEDKGMADKVPSDRRAGEKQPKDKEQIDLSKIQKGRGTKSDRIASSSSSTRKESVENQHKAFISDKEGMEQSTSKVPVSQLKESINHSVSSSTHDKSVSKIEQSEQKTDEKQQLTHHVSFSDYSSYEVETVEEEPAAGRRDTEEEKVKKKKARRSKGEESTEIDTESRAASVIIPRYKLKPTRRRKDKHKVKVYLLHSRMTSSDSLSDKSDKVDVGDGRVQQLVKFFEKIIKKTDEKKE